VRFDADSPPTGVADDLDRRVRDETWRVMVFVWLALCAAIIPLELERVPEMLGPFLEHLSRSKNASRTRQIPRFLNQLQQAGRFG